MQPPDDETWRWIKLAFAFLIAGLVANLIVKILVIIDMCMRYEG